MATKKQAQKEARQLRKEYPNKTVSVVKIKRPNVWGVRFLPKGKRAKFTPEPAN